MVERHGGDEIGEVLARHGIGYVFTLCGGHISPIFTRKVAFAVAASSRTRIPSGSESAAFYYT